MNKQHNDLSLLVRLPNWVGDVVMALPALQALQANHVKLHLIGKSWAADLLSATNLPICSLNKSFWQTTKSLTQIKCKKALLLTNSFSSALMTRLANKISIGYRTDLRHLLLKSSLTKQAGQHEVTYFWDIARFASQFWFPDLTWPKDIPEKISLSLSPPAIISAKQHLAEAHIDKPFWVVCPFAHGTGSDGKSKIWPHWRQLSAQLKQQRLIVCPAKNEETLCSELVPEATVLSGLNLSEYAAVLAAADKVIANDSGPMHIAAAVGARTLGIFGVSDPMRSGPWGGDFVGNLGEWPSLSKVISQLE